jgi:tRNA (cmo5U34)-methyltransferase
MMMDVKEIFDKAAVRYDQQRQKVFPRFNDFYQTIITLIPFYQEDNFRFLDLGAGTGLVADLILRAFPNSAADILDVSEKMLEKARERFAGNERVRFWIRDYANDGLPDRYGLIVSAMSIHHLDDIEKKLLFERIFHSLVPGGAFINAELVKGTTEETEKIYQRVWKDHLEKSGLSREILSQIYERTSYDKTAYLSSQLEWLRSTGFLDVDCFYKYFNFAVYAGRRPVS